MRGVVVPAQVNLKFGWTKINEIAVKGSAFCEVKLSERDFANYFTKVNDSRTFSERIRVINGFFAVVIKKHDYIFAAVDRIRSIPLFYALKNNNFYLSDSTRWIWEQFGYPEPESYSSAEFLLTGFVTGHCTLIYEIKQLQAGEMLFYDIKTGTLKTERYYRYLHSPMQGSKDEFLERLDIVTQNAIKRLIEYADGRTIVIPLSGGLDSRLIAMQLKKHGYDNIIAFSYGKPGNHEAEVSRHVAEHLKIPWKLVPYSHELWRKWYSSSEYLSYVERADGLCSVAHIQDWPAVWELSINKTIPEDAVFVPGHSADFVAGSHIPPEFLSLKKVGQKRLVNAIWYHHYSLANTKKVAQTINIEQDLIKEDLKKKIQQLINNIPNSSIEEAINAYEYWDWQERQAKFIVNSVRVYDFWGYDWWLPWWDSEFMEFWETVPLYLRINKNLYDTYVGSIQNEANIFLKEDKFNSSFDKLKMNLKNLEYKSGIGYLIREIYSARKVLRSENEYYNHPLAWYGIIEIKQFKLLVGFKGNINSIISFDQLKSYREMCGIK